MIILFTLLPAATAVSDLPAAGRAPAGLVWGEWPAQACTIGWQLAAMELPLQRRTSGCQQHTTLARHHSTRGCVLTEALSAQYLTIWPPLLQVMAPTGSPSTVYGGEDTSEQLKAAIEHGFGNFTTFQTQFATAAKGLFGSGWTWLCLTDITGTLIITTTPNQDNPLMSPKLLGTTERCWPVLGLDVWEHAFYLAYRNEKPRYVDAWWAVVNWGEVSNNYARAESRDLEQIHMMVTELHH